MTSASESRRLRFAFPVLLLALGLCARTARADEPEAGTRMAARELAVAGAEAFDKQDFAAALDRFQRAEALYKVPSIAIMVARCYARVGKVVEAVDKYEETLRMPLDASAPEAFQRAVADAAAEVEPTRARVARLELDVPSDAPADLEVTLDDRKLPKALWGVLTPVNPGAHRVVAHAAGRQSYAQDVSLQEGGRQVIQIRLPLERDAGPVDVSSTSRSGRAGLPTLPIVLFAAGGVALATGTVTGIAALSHKSTLDEHCSPGCSANMASDLDSFRLTRTLSYVGFGVGIVAVGAGAYFLLHEGSSGSQVGALLLPGGVAAAGTF